MKYEVRKCDEMGHDYCLKTFNDWLEASEYEEECERYNEGWHFYIKPIEEK